MGSFPLSNNQHLDNDDAYMMNVNNLEQFHEVIMGIVEHLGVIQTLEILEQANTILASLFGIMIEIVDEMEEQGYPTQNWKRIIPRSSLTAVRAIYAVRRRLNAEIVDI